MWIYCSDMERELFLLAISSIDGPNMLRFFICILQQHHRPMPPMQLWLWRNTGHQMRQVIYLIRKCFQKQKNSFQFKF